MDTQQLQAFVKFALNFMETSANPKTPLRKMGSDSIYDGFLGTAFRERTNAALGKGGHCFFNPLTAQDPGLIDWSRLESQRGGSPLNDLRTRLDRRLAAHDRWPRGPSTRGDP